jgi:penicillin-binding protein 2
VRNWRHEVIETRVVRESQHGRDLKLTLDAELQKRTERILDEALTKVTSKGVVDTETMHGVHNTPTCPQGGCIVAIDVRTGAVIAAASAPRCDLNMQLSSDAAAWDDILGDKRSPLLSRSTHMALPPGSAFKIVTAVASVESGKMPPHTLFHCQGYLDKTTEHRCLIFRHYQKSHGDVDLFEAMAKSCNVYFYTAARRMGPETLVEWAKKLGVGQKTGIDLPSESSGHLRSPDQLRTVGKRKLPWRPGDTLDLAIGQSDLQVTPLQVARFVAAVANDGFLVTPHLAADSETEVTSDSELMSRFSNRSQGHAIEGLHADTLDYVREGLVRAVNDPHGTGYKHVRMKEITIAGKTGTAQAGTSEVDHAWFAGYVPAEQPRIAFVVVLQNGGGGGAAAGPVAREFVQQLLQLELVAKPGLIGSAERSSR